MREQCALYWSVPVAPVTLPEAVVFFFEGSAAHRDLHSFPTRRSSDLYSGNIVWRQFMLLRDLAHNAAQRSEEHTSELQSRLHLVCRLLLEKKNTTPPSRSPPPTPPDSPPYAPRDAPPPRLLPPAHHPP